MGGFTNGAYRHPMSNPWGSPDELDRIPEEGCIIRGQGRERLMPKRILVVEDTKNIREIISYVLKNRGYEVLEAADGDTAWKLATTEKLDAMVLDAMLPGKKGFEICSDLKESDEYKHIPILILTAIAQGSGKDDDYWKEKSKADDFMSKPFRAQELLKRVQMLVGDEKK